MGDAAAQAARGRQLLRTAGVVLAEAVMLRYFLVSQFEVARMFDTSNDPKIIDSKHNGFITRDGVTVELCIYRLEDTKWTLEVVDAAGTSIVWDDEFETDDAALAEFERTVCKDGMLEFQPAVSKGVN